MASSGISSITGGGGGGGASEVRGISISMLSSITIARDFIAAPYTRCRPREGMNRVIASLREGSGPSRTSFVSMSR